MTQQTAVAECPLSANKTQANHRRNFGTPCKIGSDRRGSIMFLVLFMLVLFLATCAFSIDVAMMNLANAELRAATDSAAKAAVTELGLTEDINLAQQAAIRTAGANTVGGRPLILESQDIAFGRVQMQNDGSFTFTSGVTPYSAAKVRSRKLSGTASGNVKLFFGSLFGTASYNTQLTATATRLDRDLCLVLDRSGSMAGQKLTDLKSGVSTFLDTIGGPNFLPLIGLATYSTNATLDQNLTSTLSTVQQKSDAMIADGYTNIGAGINIGRTILAGGRDSNYAEKVMILMTDGIHNQATSPEDAALIARQERIVIHTITFGTDADQDRMRAIAVTTGGTFHHAPDGATLQQAFREIATTIRTSLVQ